MKKLKRIVKRILRFIVLIIIILTGVILYRLYIPRNAYTKIDYCVDIARKINWIDLSHFECDTIKEIQGVVSFGFSIKNEYVQHMDDELFIELIKIRNYVSEYMEEHPENELNNKKIRLHFNTLPGDYMRVYNYDFINGSELVDAKEFAYFDIVHIENLSTLQGLSDARIISRLCVQKVDSLEFFKEFTNLKYLDYNSDKISEEEKEYLRNLLPDCTIEFASDLKNQQ